MVWGFEPFLVEEIWETAPNRYFPYLGLVWAPSSSPPSTPAAMTERGPGLLGMVAKSRNRTTSETQRNDWIPQRTSVLVSTVPKWCGRISPIQFVHPQGSPLLSAPKDKSVASRSVELNDPGGPNSRSLGSIRCTGSHGDLDFFLEHPTSGDGFSGSHDSMDQLVRGGEILSLVEATD